MIEGVKIRRVNFFNNRHQKLVGILEENSKDKIVIICHGFAGNKNRNFIHLLDDYLIKNNFSVLIFDFTGNGESEGEFSDGTYTQEIDDLGKAVDFVEKIGYKKICLMGHSMGGAVSILRASRDKRVNCLISIASPGEDKFRFRKKYVNTEEKRKQLDKQGYVIMEKNNKRLTKEFLDDAEKKDLKEAVQKIKIPFLMIHGEDDETVPLHEAKELYKDANEPKALEIISHADHCFGYKGMDYNPNSSIKETKEYKELKQNILQFLEKWLN